MQIRPRPECHLKPSSCQLSHPAFLSQAGSGTHISPQSDFGFHTTAGAEPELVDVSCAKGQISFPYLPPGGSVVKNPTADAGDVDSIPGSGKSLGEGNGNPLRHSCLGNSTDRGAWQATIHGVMKRRTRPSIVHLLSHHGGIHRRPEPLAPRAARGQGHCIRE